MHIVISFSKNRRVPFRISYNLCYEPSANSLLRSQEDILKMCPLDRTPRDEISKSFPKEERYALTSQIRDSSRSVAANLAEAFRKRRYKRAFIAKLSDSEGEAAETQTWLDFAKDCKYIPPKTCKELNQKYEHVIGMLVKMIHSADQWTIGK